MQVGSLITLNRQHLGRGLRGLRLINQLSLDELGFYVKKDIGYLSRLETGKVSIKLDTLSEILSYYNMSVKEFYDKLDDFI